MSTWWERNPRLLSTTMFLARTATNGRLVRAGNTLLFEEDIVAGGVVFGLRIRLSENHPFEPPRAYLAYPDLPVTVAIHRFTNGALCLHGEEEWHPNQTLLWLRNRAVSWIGALLIFTRTGEWPNQ